MIWKHAVLLLDVVPSNGTIMGRMFKSYVNNPSQSLCFMFSVKNTKLQVYQKLRPPHPNKIPNYIYYHIYHVLCNKCFNVVCITYVLTVK